jgi:hypothetical protein
MKYADLAQLLDANADRLTATVLGEMYQNPFWHERFGERANVHGKKDGRFHIDYLIQALASDDVRILEQYARWLQQVLTSRGMCSRHLADNFSLLGRAIGNESWPDREVAVRLLGAAAEALKYPAGTPRRIQDAAPAIVAHATDSIYARHPEWLERWGEAGRARCADDLDYHLQYIADALALADAPGFARYAVWIGDFLGRRKIPKEHLVEALETLAASADAVAADVSAEVRRVVELAVAELTRPR